MLDTRLLSQNELVHYLNKANAFLLPMKECPYPDASFSIKLLDYLAIGKPVICCAEGYLSSFISDNNIGLSIEPGNHLELSKMILKLEKDDAMRFELATNARNVALNLFSHTSFKNSINQFFMQLYTNARTENG